MNDIDPRLWYLIGGLLAVGLVAGLVWYVRQISLKRAAVPSAFLIALAVHAALGAGLFYVGLGQQIVEAVQKAQAILPSLENYAASTRFEAHEGYRSAAQPFELVKELGAKDSVATTDLPQLPLATPEMRISAGGLKVELPVPREETPGQRAEEMTPAPNTPAPSAPARTAVREVEAPAVPDAPLENVASVPSQTPVESRAAAEPVDLVRAPAVVDPLAKAGPVRGAIPGGPGEKIVPGDLRDDRAGLPLPPVRPANTGAPLVRASRPALEDVTVSTDPLPTGTAEPGAGGGSKTGKGIVAVDVARQGTQLPGVNLGPPGTGGSGGASGPSGVSTDDLGSLPKPGGGLAPDVPNAVPTFGPGGLPQRRGVNLGVATGDTFVDQRQRDKDLITDGQMKGQKILMINFFRDDEVETSPLAGELTTKGFDVERIAHPLPPLAEFEALLDKSQQLWLWSSGEADRLPKSHLQAVLKRWKEGKLAICLLADNTPFTAEAAAILAAISPGSTISGSYLGTKDLRARSNRGSGFDSKSTLFHNLTILYEGTTVSTMSGPGLVPVCYASNGAPLIATFQQKGSSRLVVHGGFTSFFRRFWNDEGVSRFAINCAAWLSGVEGKTEDSKDKK